MDALVKLEIGQAIAQRISLHLYAREIFQRLAQRRPRNPQILTEFSFMDTRAGRERSFDDHVTDAGNYRVMEIVPNDEFPRAPYAKPSSI